MTPTLTACHDFTHLHAAIEAAEEDITISDEAGLLIGFMRATAATARDRHELAAQAAVVSLWLGAAGDGEPVEVTALRRIAAGIQDLLRAA